MQIFAKSVQIYKTSPSWTPQAAAAHLQTVPLRLWLLPWMKEVNQTKHISSGCWNHPRRRQISLLWDIKHCSVKPLNSCNLLCCFQKNLGGFLCLGRTVLSTLPCARRATYPATSDANTEAGSIQLTWFHTDFTNHSSIMKSELFRINNHPFVGWRMSGCI